MIPSTDAPALDFVELYNRGNLPLDISGCFLSDDPDANKFTIPPGTIIPARGFVSYNETQLGFSLKAEGESIYFRNAANTRRECSGGVRRSASPHATSSGQRTCASQGRASARAITARFCAISCAAPARPIIAR